MSLIVTSDQQKVSPPYIVYNNLGFILDNVKGIQASEKQFKIFDYIKSLWFLMDFYYYRKHTPLSMIKNKDYFHRSDRLLWKRVSGVTKTEN